MSTSRIFRAALPVAIALAFVSTAALAADPAPRLLATAGGVQVDPMIAAPAYQLRIAGPDGKVVEDTHLDGELMLIQPKTLGYARWLDGTYRYELVPVLGVRQRGDSEAAQMPGKQTANLIRGGTFSVQGGVLRLPGKATTSPTGSDPVAGAGIVQPADVVTPDDAIIQSSLCVGFDCVENESFGFDTIRLKENNTRIGFLDTSVGDFPSNDWTIVANDSASGGASYLGFEDVTGAKFPFRVSAGAPTDALFVSPQGNIGLGTGTPALDVHLLTPDTPVIRFDQSGAGGFTAQTWDVAGNEANFFVRDATGGSRLPFRIRPGAPTSSIDIAASGNVGIGTASPGASLDVQRAGSNSTLRISTVGGAFASTWDITNNVASGRLNFTDDPTGARIPFKIGRTANDNLLRIGALNNSTVEVNGKLKVTGDIQVSGSVGPDYVFAPGFALPTIDDHAAFMTENRHLPKVGAAQVDAEGNGVMNLGEMSHGMLEELEYAHLYIADLDRTVDTLQQRLDERDAQVEALLDEVKAIRAELDAK